ncbi:MAG TPA: ATP-binding domain-containing protein, partial [Actinomycetota bacterium]|nr:ATP-binding domain-containing protein [Actinomycetota bacterium]
TMCIVAPPSMLAVIADATGASSDIGEAVSVLPVEEAKGLEFDEVVVAEPAALVKESPQGLRALYVALTRATRRVRLVHEQPLPEPLSQAP